MDVVQGLLDTLLQGNFVFQIKLPINLSDDAALNEIVTDVIRDAMHTIINKLDQNIKNKNLPPLEDDTSAGSGEDESSEDDDSDKEEEKTLISGLNIPNVLFAVKRLFYSIQGPPIFAESELARKIRNIIKFKIKHFVLTSQLEKGMDILKLEGCVDAMGFLELEEARFPIQDMTLMLKPDAKDLTETIQKIKTDLNYDTQYTNILNVVSGTNLTNNIATWWIEAESDPGRQAFLLHLFFWRFENDKGTEMVGLKPTGGEKSSTNPPMYDSTTNLLTSNTPGIFGPKKTTVVA